MSTQTIDPQIADVEMLSQKLAISRAMSDNSPVNIIMATTDLVITYLNPSSVNTLRKFEHLLPFPADQLVGKSIDSFHKNPSYQRKMLANPRNLPHRAVIQLGPEKLDLLVSAVY